MQRKWNSIDVKIDHPVDAEVPIEQWVADIGMIATMFECLDVLVHTKHLLGELNVIDYDTRIGAVLIGNCTKRVQYTASASTVFTKFSRAEAVHSLGERGRA